MQQYRILNKKGLVYSRSLGWIHPSNKLYGHLFNKKDVTLIMQSLTDQGHTDLHAKLDVIGTFFMISLDSPFSNPAKLIQLLLFTLVFFLATYLGLHFIPGI